MDIEGMKHKYKDLTSVEQCRVMLSMNFAGLVAYIFGFFFIVFTSNFIHTILRPISQPRIISETFVGILVGNLTFIYGLVDISVQQALRSIADFGMICYMFVLGLEMDPYVLFHRPTYEARVAYAGMLTTFIIACALIPFLKLTTSDVLELTVTIAIIISNTSSPLLTRLITELKIGKSDIGRLVVAAGIHSDMFSTLLMSIGLVVDQSYHKSAAKDHGGVLLMVLALVGQTVLISKIGPIFMRYINDRNPEGKAMKGSHLVLSIAFVVLVCGFMPATGFSPIMSAFMTGIVLPRSGRLSKMMISKINYFLTTIFYPMFFFWVGVRADFREFHPGTLRTWTNLFLFFMIATLGKVSGTLVAGLLLGFHWPESLSLGLLLNVKGHFHMFMAVIAMEHKLLTTHDSITMILVIIFTIAYTPFVVAYIITRARKRSLYRQMALQWLDASTELRIVLCLHGPQSVPTAINFMEISRGGVEPGVAIYATDMVELTDHVAATLVPGEGTEAITVTDESVVSMREQITNAFQIYMEGNGDGITLRRMLALSTLNNIHQDICILAEEVLASLIILPFHKNQRVDGKLDEGHQGFRHVNRKVLRHAPCSVGILVDRGLGLINKASKSFVSLSVAVIFMGGKDDREALAYAGRIARHPGVNLTVIRFLLDSNADNLPVRASNTRVLHDAYEQEEEMKHDDECFAEFYERHVQDGQVAYLEKYLENSAQTVSTLRSLEGLYALFIVGRGSRKNSILTAGMSDWEECPELGPIGDILSASDFSIMASVLIIQQHSIKGNLDGLDDEFSIM